jgi:hypothetical protein
MSIQTRRAEIARQLGGEAAKIRAHRNRTESRLLEGRRDGDSLRIELRQRISS